MPCLQKYAMCAAALATLAAAAPSIALPHIPRHASADWDAGGTTEYPIQFCNSTETALLGEALQEMKLLVEHARDHILRFGHDSEQYRKYFGNASTAEPAGWYNALANGDKTDVLFRCDDPDGNCQLPEWGGHWRGENGSDETVICEYSLTNRWPLAGLCGYGYTVAGGETNAYFASDLIHRIFHTDTFGQGTVDHYADSYDECLQLAIDAPEQAVRNSATLSYFALDVYAYDIAVPGQGCTGHSEEEEHEEEHDQDHDVASSTTSVATAEPTEASTTQSAPSECHTHSDGEVHCD